MAVDLIEMLKGAVSGQAMEKIGGTFEMDKSKAASVFETISSVILSGLIKKASTPGGAEEIFEQATQQDGGILDQIGDLFGGGGLSDTLQKNGGGLPETIFGGGQSKLLDTIAKAVGIDGATIGKLATMIGPILMAILGRHIAAKELDAKGLSHLLTDQKEHLDKHLPPAVSSSLGLVDTLSDARNSISEAVSAVTGTGRTAGKSVSSAASDAASMGGRLVKLVVPVVVLAAIGFAIWKSGVFDSAAPNQTPPATVANKDEKVSEPVKFSFSKLDVTGLGETGTTLKNGFKEITTGLANLKADDIDNAKKLAAVIAGFTGEVDKLNLGSLDGVKKQFLTVAIEAFKGKINELMASVPEGLKPLIKPAIENLLSKLKF